MLSRTQSRPDPSFAPLGHSRPFRLWPQSCRFTPLLGDIAAQSDYLESDSPLIQARITCCVRFSNVRHPNPSP